MAVRFSIEPSPTDPNLLSVTWTQWFEILRMAVSVTSDGVSQLFSAVGVLQGQIEAINNNGVDKLVVTYKAGFPTVAELRNFSMSVWKNTASNEWRLWFLESGQRYSFILTPMDGPI